MLVHRHYVGAFTPCWSNHTFWDIMLRLVLLHHVLGQELLLVHAHHVGAMAQVVGAGTSRVGACSPLMEFVDKRRPLLAAPSREMM